MKSIIYVYLSALLLSGCSQKSTAEKSPSNTTTQSGTVTRTEAHAHGIGAHGGVVFELGKYHAEFTVDHAKKECRLFMLNADETNPQPIKVTANELLLTTKETKSKDGKLIAKMTIQLLPEKNDGRGTIFIGTDPGLGSEASLAGVVAGMIDGKPSQGEFKEGQVHGHLTGSTTQRESELFLKPGGIYTAADIEKNGRVLPSVKFVDMSWSHDDDLKTGDKICPVTFNKADAQCVWYDAPSLIH